VRARPVLLPGWWDAANKRWSEDRYQDGTATGNVAWVGLAVALDRHEESLADLTGAPQVAAGRERRGRQGVVVGEGGAAQRRRNLLHGRIRNAYRAGPVRARPVLLPGWWDAANKRWSEASAVAARALS
jgi:hypothetical protein